MLLTLIFFILQCYNILYNSFVLMSILLGPGKEPHQTRKSNQKKKQENGKCEDLLVFGYHCKLFRDNSTAENVNKGKTLIPWMGNADLMIDRYDCRGHLYHLPDFDFSSTSRTKNLTSEEMDIESILDEERYLDLRKDMDEENILQEEDEKRSKNLYDPHTAYQTIGYSYEGNDNYEGKSLSDLSSDETYKQYCQYYGYDMNDPAIKSYYQSYYDYQRPPAPPEPPGDAPVPPTPTKSGPPKSSETEPPEKFQPPEGIEIPSKIEVPETRKMQSIIDKTALFLSKQSGQMEIVLKTKQSGNPQFSFLNFENYLNPYYKFILGMIRDGKYTPKSETTTSSPIKDGGSKETNEKDSKEDDGEKDKESDSDYSDDDDDDDGEHLHPLLQAHKKPIPKTEPVKKQESKPLDPTSISSPSSLSPIVPKPAGRIEDLAKIYMSMKYKSNPEPEPLPPPPQPAAPQYRQHPMQHYEQQQQYYQQHEYNSQPPPPPRGQFPGPPPQFTPEQPYIGNNYRPHSRAPLRPPPSNFYAVGLPRMNPPGPHQMNQPGPSQMNQPGPPGVSFSPQQMHLAPPGEEGSKDLIMHRLQEDSRIMTHHQHQQQRQDLQNINQYSQPCHRPPDQQQSNQHPTSQYWDDNQTLTPPGVDSDYDRQPDLPPPPPLPMAPNLDNLPKIVAVAKLADDHRPVELSQESQNERPHQDQETSSVGPSKNIENSTDERYRPSDMLSQILQSRERTTEAENFDDRYVDSPKRYDSPQSHPDQYPSTLQYESPGGSAAYDYSRSIDYNSPRHDYDSPSQGYDSPVHHMDASRTEYQSKPFYYSRNDSPIAFKNETSASQIAETPFQQLSESLKMLHKKEENIQPPGCTSNSKNPPKEELVEPSADLQPVIDRLATYVARNGEEFELGIKEKGDPRFDFLNPWNIYHIYYKQTKQKFIEQFEVEKKEECERKKNIKVSFGLKTTGKIATSGVKRKPAVNAAAIFNQQDDDVENVAEGDVTMGNGSFKLMKDTDADESNVHATVLEERKLTTGNKFRTLATPQQQAALKRKLQTDMLRKDSATFDNRDERRRKAASFVERLKSKRDYSSDGDDSETIRKRTKDTGSSNSSSISENSTRKQGAFFAAINEAFKGN